MYWNGMLVASGLCLFTLNQTNRQTINPSVIIASA